MHIRAKLEYACPVWSAASQTNVDSLERLQRRAIRIILGLRFRDNVEIQHYDLLKLDSLSVRRLYATACYGYKLLSGITPAALDAFRPVHSSYTYNLRNNQLKLLPGFRIPSRAYKSSPVYFAVSLLNRIGEEIYAVDSLHQFKQSLALNRNILDAL